MLMRLLMRQAFVEPYVLTQFASAAKANSAETLPKENEAKRGTDRKGKKDSRIDEHTERQRPTETGRQTDRQTFTDRSPYTEKHRNRQRLRVRVFESISGCLFDCGLGIGSRHQFGFPYFFFFCFCPLACPGALKARKRAA